MTGSLALSYPHETASRVLRKSTGDTITLHRQLAQSGQGSIFTTDDPGVLAKIYHTTSLHQVEKLSIMIDNPPSDPTLGSGHMSIAWPEELLMNRMGEVQGFLMTRVKKAHPLSHVANPRLRRLRVPHFNWYYLTSTALNVASVLNALHAHSYVVGDIKPENFLVNDQALVTILDTDSFQIHHPGTLSAYLCPVGSQGYTPRELMGKDLSQFVRSEIHDRFGLAVLIYQLLFGMHPYSGLWDAEGDPPGLDECIWRGYFPFSPQSQVKPGPLTYPLSALSLEMEEAFYRAFEEGHNTPSLRPSAHDWIRVLTKSLEELDICTQNNAHFYYPKRYGKCHWCDRAKATGQDVFAPPTDRGQEAPFLIQKRFEKALKEGDMKTLQTLWPKIEKGIPLETTHQFREKLNELNTMAQQLDQWGHNLKEQPGAQTEIMDHLYRLSKCPSPLLSQPHPLFDHKSPLEWMTAQGKILENKKKLLNLGRQAAQQKTSLLPLFQSIWFLWDSSFETDADLEFFKEHISQIQMLAQQYRSLKEAVRSEKDTLLSLWNPLFEQDLKQDGLWGMFIAQIYQQFKENSKGLFKNDAAPVYTQEEEGILIQIPHIDTQWPNHYHYGLNIHTSQESSSVAQKRGHMTDYLIPRQVWAALGQKLFLPQDKDQEISLSWTPFVFFGSTPVYLHASRPLCPQPVVQELQFALQLDRPWNTLFSKKDKRAYLYIYLLSSQDIALPSLCVRQLADGSGDALCDPIALPALDLKAGRPFVHRHFFENIPPQIDIDQASSLVLELQEPMPIPADTGFFLTQIPFPKYQEVPTHQDEGEQIND